VFDPSGPVLGIDPGLSRCGYGAVARNGQTMTAVACGVLRTHPDDDLPDRLAQLQDDLAALVAELAPRAVAVERVLFQANVRTAMTTGQASGLALAVAARAGVPVTHYSPNEVKLAVAGYGAADKAQVQDMVARLLRLDAPPRPADAADALALAVCHSWSGPVRAAAATPVGGGLDRAVAAALEREVAR
jgi:crossover junction endodeoxyribonuclease RuvC